VPRTIGRWSIAMSDNADAVHRSACKPCPTSGANSGRQAGIIARDSLQDRHRKRSLPMNVRNNLLTSLGICAALGSSTAWAQSEPDTSMPPAPQSYDGIQVINGGADLDQAEAIERLQSRYPLAIEISGRGGDYYVADRVMVLQRDELMTEIPNAGPWLLMDVPPGRYTLVGLFGNTELRRDVLVPTGKSTKLSWVVPSKIE
jgi:hypothetical protein